MDFSHFKKIFLLLVIKFSIFFFFYISKQFIYWYAYVLQKVVTLRKDVSSPTLVNVHRYYTFLIE